MAALTAAELMRQLTTMPPEAPVRFYVTVTDGDWSDEEVHVVDGVYRIAPEDSPEASGEVYLEHTIER